ncbi:hsp90 co-chaperone Cdc37 [Drosophila virilis]|uniref:Hsp90 co-chaperone Cdc37 n=1 Tax=Drosophila virilis TaxID=7244 RepID=CDC37_DROVI|nr:hsp90 co-chaperone Cdc37 [Drosophila virilis]Q24740.1 RecName: Full=Hsp90 co-chaperone Cdc37; AltName: Full=Hsp90 chaperone protein kinase-targeting subunit [Drosophila virilis]AAA50964.1 cell division cycle protein [Drosophila virilis]EDW68898.1 Cdc37 [Drosophila virilis]
MVDYSKWKNIEISDDEDETHPNIDTPSLFRWRHQARVERMAESEKEKEELKKKRQSYQARLINVKELISKKEGDEVALKKELEKIENEGKELDRQENELLKREKKTPWNVDTISKPGFEKTVINKKPPRKAAEDLTEEEREQRMKQFVKENEKLCKQYGMLRKYDDSKRFLQEHLDLVCEETANYLVIWSINLEMEEKHDLMAHVAHQCICMQYILELAKQLDVDPRACVSSFFSKIQQCVPEYRQQFESEIEGFKERIQKRAQEKLQEAMAQLEEEEKQERMGPGGLDPADVFESLPEELKACFESRDIELLQKTIATMPVDQAKYHMKRCVDSGLWVPNAADVQLGNDETEAKDDETTTATNETPTEKENSKSQNEKSADAAKEEPLYAGVSTDDVD